MIKVSIIIPAYNVEDYIEDCLVSLTKQSLKEIEVIVVNDGSTDHTQEKAEVFKGKIKDLKVIKQVNSGPGVARNLGLKYATGEYIIFLDADDSLPSNAVAHLYNKAKALNADIIAARTVWKEEMQYREVEYNKFWFNSGMDYKKNYVHNVKLLTGLPTVTSKLFRTSIIKTHNIEFPPYIGEDVVFWLEYWHRAESIYLVDEIVYYRRQRQDENNKSITQTVTLKNIKEKLKVVELCTRYCKENNLYEARLQLLYQLRAITEMILSLTKLEERREASGLVLEIIQQNALNHKQVSRYTYLNKRILNQIKARKQNVSSIKFKIAVRKKCEKILRGVYRKIRRY